MCVDQISHDTVHIEKNFFFLLCISNFTFYHNNLIIIFLYHFAFTQRTHLRDTFCEIFSCLHFWLCFIFFLLFINKPCVREWLVDCQLFEIFDPTTIEGVAHFISMLSSVYFFCTIIIIIIFKWLIWALGPFCFLHLPC